MRRKGPVAGKRRSVEDVHHLRLMALLHDLVRERKLKGAAAALGVDPRTLAASLERGTLSGLVRVAAERLLLTDGDAAMAQQRAQVQALAQRVEGIDTRLAAVEHERRGPDDGEGDLQALGRRLDAAAQALQVLTHRVARLERGRGTLAAAGSEATEHGRRWAADDPSRAAVVTAEPHPNEEVSYGPGMPAVAEWRRLNQRRGEGTKLDQVKTRERIMALEIALIEKYELTLPPDTEPLHPSQREGYLRWRRRALADLQTERARRELLRWVRRVLTLGLWWR